MLWKEQRQRCRSIIDGVIFVEGKPQEDGDLVYAGEILDTMGTPKCLCQETESQTANLSSLQVEIYNPERNSSAH